MIPILKHVQHAQGQAADPRANVWVAASAGVGKTKTLVDRLLRLLLHGAEPRQILCLTFTKAAATEMLERLYAIAEIWHRMPEAELLKACEDVLQHPPSLGEQQRARDLAPLLHRSILKIQTIHSFCQNLLQQFAADVGLTAPLVILDPLEAHVLKKQAVHQVYAESVQYPDTPLAHVIGYLAGIMDHGALEGLVAHPLPAVDVTHLCQLFDLSDTMAADVAPAVREAFDQKILDEFCEEDRSAEFVDVIVRMEQSTRQADRNFADGLRRWWLAMPEQRAQMIEDYAAVFFTTAGLVRQAIHTRYKSMSPEEIASLEAEMMRIKAYQQLREALNVVRATYAITTMTHAVADVYTRLKAGRFDYEDLIERTHTVLKSPQGPPILYSLDGGLHHILVDEAQDTSPDQWSLIQTLASEFYAGHGQHAVDGPPRTLFVVGDYKQSIYSFQGADPELFVDMQTYFATQVHNAQQAWHEVDLDVSFRSAPEIIEFINRVFEKLPLGLRAVYRPHQTACQFQGKVDVWPLTVLEEVVEPEPWALPTTVPPPPPAHKVLAQQVSTWIQQQLAEPLWLNSRQRGMQPGDVMVLVRRRHAFVEELTNSLRQAGIPVSGIDRLVLAHNIYIQDLIALGDFIITPHDDLNLAALLKSPLCQWTEEELFDVCYPRGKQSVWKYLNTLSTPRAQDTCRRLQHWRALAQRTSPYEFFHTICQQIEWPAAAAEPLDVFLDWLVWYERRGIPSLPHMLAAFRAHNPVAPTPVDAENCVRVLTIHGAKGLQAPVVMLPDTTQSSRFQDRVLSMQGMPIFAVGGWDSHPLTARIKAAYQEQQMFEYHRLLYVALTRAEERLIIAGWQNSTISETCWYTRIALILAS